MASDVDRQSTNDKVDNHESTRAENSLFVAVMSDAKPVVTRTGSTGSADLPLPPILTETPSWQNPTPPALGNQPYWTNIPQPEPASRVDYSSNYQRRSGNLEYQNPTPPPDYYPSNQQGPGSGNPYKSSWGTEMPGTQFNPAPPQVDSGKQWRAGYGGVAPGYPMNPAEPDRDSYKPWRNNWGDVAPPAIPNGGSVTPFPTGGKEGPFTGGDIASPNRPNTSTSSPWNIDWTKDPSAPGVNNQADRANYGPTPTSLRQSPWAGGADLPIPPGSLPPLSGSITPVGDKPSSGGGMKSPGDFFPGFPGPAQPSDASGAAKKPGDFFPGYPGGSSDRTGNSGDGNRSTPAVSRDEAVSAFKQDQSSRSEYSFDNAVAKLSALGKQNEVSLELLLRDWMGTQNSQQPLTFMRGTAALAAGLGEFRLDEGSRIDLTSHQDTKPRILKGFDYDFGGEATTFLRLSAGSLVEAQQYVQGHKGQVIDGQSMDDAYIRQLHNLQTEIEGKLNVIYGAHDVNGVYNTLKNEVRIHAGDWQKGLVDLQHKLDGLRTSDNRFISKSARDVALGYLAEADYMSSQNNGEDAKIMYRDSMKYLGLAMAKDANAPDNRAIQTIAEKLRAQINGAVDNQWNDPFNNPFSIPKPQNPYI